MFVKYTWLSPAKDLLNRNSLGSEDQNLCFYNLLSIGRSWPEKITLDISISEAKADSWFYIL